MPPISEEVGMEGSPHIPRKDTEMAPATTAHTVPKGSPTKQNVQRSWSMSSGEYELQKATNPKHKLPNTRSKWLIPDTDSEDDFNTQPSAFRSKENARENARSTGINKFNLPSDSDDNEEENPYASAKSPTISVKSMEPPAPPPVSTMPKRSQIETKPTGILDTNDGKTEANRPGQLQRQLSVASSTDTGHYDEIGNESIKSPNQEDDKRDGGSEPRFNFTLSKSRTRLNPNQKDDDPDKDTYAEIPKKPQWNFPSSDEDEEEDVKRNTIAQKRLFNNPKSRLSRRESSTSEEGEKPMIPPKLWDASDLLSPDKETADLPELRRSSCDSGIRESKPSSGEQEGITIEYNALHRDDSNSKGSLIGPDDEDDDAQGSQSSGFGDNQDVIEELSILSDHSSKLLADFEQSSTCVDMDQLSLDSSGRHPKRIVETHETHEIIPSENNDDDIVERIIETQTITEKLDENYLMKDYGGEDFAKYLEDDEEFVSHIFSVGRTLEKGSGKKKYKSNEFAFVENPFSPQEPQVETMPLEKKTVKQKITTLVKKKKAREDEGIYAEVQPSGLQYFSFNESKMYLPEKSQPNPLLRESTTLSSNGDNDSLRTSLRSDSLVYESVEEVSANKFIKTTRTENRKEPKTEKKSIFRGLRKLLKKNKSQQSQDSETSSAIVVVEDDYQEFVP